MTEQPLLNGVYVCVCVCEGMEWGGGEETVEWVALQQWSGRYKRSLDTQDL